MATATRTASRSRRRRSGARPDVCSTTPPAPAAGGPGARGRPPSRRTPASRRFRRTFATGDGAVRPMNGPIPLPAAPAPALARSNRGTRLPGKRPSPADGLTPLPIAWPKREGVPRFGPRSRPAVRRGRIWTDQITESVAKPAGSGRSGAENTRESGHGSSSAAFTLPPPLGRSCAPPSHLWPRPPPNSLSLPASVATQRLVLILIVALRRRPLPLLCEAPEDQVPWPHPRSSNGATPTDIYTLFAPTSRAVVIGQDPRAVIQRPERPSERRVIRGIERIQVQRRPFPEVRRVDEEERTRARQALKEVDPVQCR